MNNIGGTITFVEACKLLGKSKRQVSRYIKKGLLNPEKVKSQKGMILLN
jgi:DNA-binding transcriptional MerR regulator